MKINFQHKDKNYKADLSQPLDISLPLKEGMKTVNCFYAPYMSTSPVMAGDFIGSTEKGGPLNFLNVKFNPHGNGTHTECVGHIAKEKFTINQCLKQFWFLVEVVSVFPMKEGEDRIIKKNSFVDFCEHLGEVDAIVIRTLPNDDLKKRTNYSGSNPIYMEEEATKFLVENG
ncbi:MAG: cyclase family protein, partial [Saprospiraceae bacterium]